MICVIIFQWFLKKYSKHTVLWSQLRWGTWYYSERGRSDSQSRRAVVHIQHVPSGEACKPLRPLNERKGKAWRIKNSCLSAIVSAPEVPNPTHFLSSSVFTAAGSWSHLNYRCKKLRRDTWCCRTTVGVCVCVCVLVNVCTPQKFSNGSFSCTVPAAYKQIQVYLFISLSLLTFIMAKGQTLISE